MPLDLDGLFQEGVDVGRAESAGEIARLRAALERFADRDNWLFTGGDADPVWMPSDKPWESAQVALAKEWR